MNNWSVEFTPEALEDHRRLDGSVRILVDKAIDKVSTNPLPQNEGGYGKPLGNKNGLNLTGLLKVKLKSSGIRIIYQLRRETEIMRIIVIGLRKDEEVYQTAEQRTS